MFVCVNMCVLKSVCVCVCACVQLCVARYALDYYTSLLQKSPITETTFWKRDL